MSSGEFQSVNPVEINKVSSVPPKDAPDSTKSTRKIESAEPASKLITEEARSTQERKRLEMASSFDRLVDTNLQLIPILKALTGKIDRVVRLFYINQVVQLIVMIVLLIAVIFMIKRQ